MKNKEPKGINGLLILPLTGLILGSLFWLYNLVILIIHPSNPYILVSDSQEYTNTIHILTYIIMFLLIQYSIGLAFKKRKTFPAWTIFAMWANAITIIILYNSQGIIIISSIIWTLYLIKSKRVKNTFTK